MEINMKFRQLIYTSYKGFGGNADTRGYYATTPGISDSDCKQIAELFGTSAALMSFLEKYPVADGLSEATVSASVPRRYAYTRLPSGNYCWAVASAVQRSFGEARGFVYFHALLSAEKPRFSPIALFDCFDFYSDLSDEQFEGRVPADALPMVELRDSDIVSEHRFTDNRLDMATAELMLSAVNLARTKGKPLLLGCNDMEALSTFAEILNYLPVSDTVNISFSTLTDTEDRAKRFVLNHMGPDFDYAMRKRSRGVLVADKLGGNYSEDIRVDKFAATMVGLVYTDLGEYDRFLGFMEEYTARFDSSFDIEELLWLYYFVYTEKYLEFSSDKILNILDDRFFGCAEPQGVADRLERYIRSAQGDIHLLELYARLYSYTSDKESVKDRVLALCLNDILTNPDTTRHKTYSETLESEFGLNLYAECVMIYDDIRDELLTGVERDNVFAFIVGILSAKMPRSCSPGASQLFTDVYDALEQKSPNLVRDKLLPAVVFEDTLFTYCVDRLYGDEPSFASVVDWLVYAERAPEAKIALAFIDRAMADMLSPAIFDSVFKDTAQYSVALNRIGRLLVNPSYEKYAFAFADRVVGCITDSTATEPLLQLLSVFKVIIPKFIELLKRIREKCGEDIFTNIIYVYTKNEGVEFVKVISGEFGDIALRIVAHNVRTAERYVSVYIKQFYNAGRLCESWCELFETVTADVSPDELARVVIDVLKSVHATTDAPIVAYMCRLFNDNIWRIDHTDREFMTDALSVIRADIPADSALSEIKLFWELIKWDSGSKDRQTATIFSVIGLALTSRDKCSFITKYYLDGVVRMSRAAYIKHKDEFLLRALMLYAPDATEKVWEQAYRKERTRLRREVITAWLDLSAYMVVSTPGFRSPLLACVFSGMKPSEFMAIYKKANRHKHLHIVNQMRAYFDCLPDKTKNKAASVLM